MGESDRRLTLLTAELGKIDAIAKGARKGGSRLAGSSDPLSVATLSLALGKRNLFITQAQPMSSFRGLRADFERLALALALVELYQAVVPFEEPSEETYRLLVESLHFLEVHPRPVVAAVWAQLQLLQISGVLPQFDRCVASGEPIRDTRPLLSPSAGGLIEQGVAHDYGDRFAARPEVLWGLARMAELDTPPPNLKFAEEALATLLPFWRYFAEKPLPASESCVAELRHAANGNGD